MYKITKSSVGYLIFIFITRRMDLYAIFITHLSIIIVITITSFYAYNVGSFLMPALMTFIIIFSKI